MGIDADGAPADIFANPNMRHLPRRPLRVLTNLEAWIRRSLVEGFRPQTAEVRLPEGVTAPSLDRV